MKKIIYITVSIIFTFLFITMALLALYVHIKYSGMEMGVKAFAIYSFSIGAAFMNLIFSTFTWLKLIKRHL